MKKHQRENDAAHNVNQQIATAVRVQLPRDGSAGKKPYHEMGEMPYGGYQSMWNFSGNNSTKESPTDKPGKKVY